MTSSPTRTDPVIAVAVPVPGLGLLSYRTPNRSAAPPAGARVLVPLGGRRVVGCVVARPVVLPKGSTLRDVVSVLDEAPYLPETVVDLALWVGEYYAAGPGDALAVAMPPGARTGNVHAFRTTAVVELGDVSRAPGGARQRELVEFLRGAPQGLATTQLAARGISSATIQSLTKRGVVRIRRDVAERDPLAGDAERNGTWSLGTSAHAGRALSGEQDTVLGRLREMVARGGFNPVLLQGVTGSGKTEVYLRLTAEVLTRGQQVLVLVPEIALTPALAGQLRARFGSRVAIQHSGLSDGERHDQWHRIRRGDIDVVIGTRSAVFAPLERLGAIIVDEEHDGSYKQDESPRYNARDVAVMRARMEKATVVLGSATPSLESATNAAAGRYTLLELTKRILDRPLASVRVVDMRQEYARRGADVTLSETLLAAIEQRMSRKEQTLVLLNRRGFAAVIFCRQCGAAIDCPHCSVTLTFHKAARRLKCHYCNYATGVPSRCSACGGEFLEQSGFGTERIEGELCERFPAARIARVDRDTVRRRGSLALALGAVASGDVDILVGTQMVAKGHDFPSVTLVGVVSADVGLGLADFRAAERTFQLLTQVVGRAGRGTIAGEAVIQTLYPDHYSVVSAAAQDYAAFFEQEMKYRISLRYPPHVSMINVVVKGRSLDAAMTDALELVKRIRRYSAGSVLGPAPAAITKVKDEFRAQFFIKGTRRRAMREALEQALGATPEIRRRAVVDVDPLSVI